MMSLTKWGEYKIAIVSHGPEVLIFSKENYEKYKEIVDRIESLNKTYGVKIYVCRNAMRSLGLDQSQLQPFVEVVPAGVVELAVLQEKGYRLIPTLVRDLKKFKQH